MPRRANPSLIGGFVVGAVFLAVVGLVLFGGGRFFRQVKPLVAYFEESVKGVSIGAPVTFQGAKIGTVTDVRVVIDPVTMGIVTPVFFEIDAGRLTESSGGRFSFREDSTKTKALIQRGLRATLETQSLVTGQVGIALEFHPETPVRLTGLSKDHQEMPTIPSDFERLAQTIEKLPIEAIVVSAKETLDGLREIVRSPETRATLRALNTTVQRSEQTLIAVQKLAQHVDAQIDPLMTQVNDTAKTARGALAQAQSALAQAESTLTTVGPSVNAAVKDYQQLAVNLDARLERLTASLDRTLTGLQQTLGGADEMMGEGSPVRVSLVGALDDLADAAQSIRALADYLERNPNSIVFGKGRPSR